MHPGIVAWLHYKTGAFAFYQSIADMEPEIALVFLHLLRKDVKAAANATQADLDKKHAEMTAGTAGE